MSAQEIHSRPISARGRALLVAGVLGLGLAIGGPAVAATSGCGEDYYDGLRAYDAGNKDAAIQIWTRSALTGDVRSQNRLGEVYEDPRADDHVLMDYREAHKWYNLAANNDLQVCSGDFGSKEARAARDHAKEARDRLEARMTARGISEAQIDFVDIYKCRGDARSLYQLGMVYQSGTGLLQSSLDACVYFAIAASKGDAAAKDRLDVLANVLKPEQLESCQREAAKWEQPKGEECRKGLSGGACKGGSQVPWLNRQAALKSLGYYHGRLDGAPGSRTQAAVRAFQHSLKAEATGTLSEPQICMLIEQAAINGDGASQATLGEMYYSGIGKSKNTDTAVQWLKRAADRGVPGALYRLGVMYATGDGGVDRDLAYGCKLLRDADAAGHPQAQRELNRYCD